MSAENKLHPSDAPLISKYTTPGDMRLLWDFGLLTSNNVTLVIFVSVSYVQKQEGAVGIGRLFCLSVHFLWSVFFYIQFTNTAYHAARGERRLR